MTASSSTPETTTNGSMPACRNTWSRPGEADPSTTRVICASSPHVGPFQQGDLLPAEDRVAQLVHGQPPAGALGRSLLTSAAGGAAHHRDQRGQLLVGRRALEHPNMWLVRVTRRSLTVRFVLVAHRSWIVRLVAVTHYVRSAHLTQSGMFPCFLGGIWAILRSSSRSAVPM